MFSTFAISRKRKQSKKHKRSRERERRRLQKVAVAAQDTAPTLFEPLEPRVLLSALVWTPGPDLPTPRTDAVAVVAPDNAVIVLGGQLGPDAPVAAQATDVPRLAENGTNWTLAHNINTTRNDLGAVRSGNDIFVIGGTNNAEGIDEVAWYDYANEDSQDVAKMAKVRYDFGYAVDGSGNAYAIGGIGVLEDAEIWSFAERYDSSADTWTDIAELPQALHGLSAIGDGGGGHIFVFGGSTTFNDSGIQSAAYSLDTTVANATWTAIAPMPIATRDSAVVMDDGGLIYVLGGMTSTGDATDAVQVYDPLTDSWTSQTVLPEPIYSHAAVYNAGGRIMVMGGFDATGAATDAVHKTQQLNIPETAPVFTSVAPTSTTPGDPYSYDANAVGNPDPTFSLFTAPAGMTIDATTGLVSWTPTVAQAGIDHNVTVRASSQAGDTDQAFMLTVVADAAPVITTAAVTTASHGSLYTYDVDVTGSPAPAFLLVVAPAGMTIDSDTGLISWQPNVTQFGDIDVTVRASNRAGDNDQAFVITGLVDTIPPTPASNLTTTFVGTTSADLVWDAATDNTGVVDHYNLYSVQRTPRRRFRPSRTFYVLEQENLTTTSTMVTGLTPLTLSKYVVRAVDELGNESMNSNVLEVNTESPPILRFSSSNLNVNGQVDVIANNALNLRIFSQANPTAMFSLVSVTGSTDPTTMSIDPVTGVVSWTPVAADVGVTSATFRATNTVEGVVVSTDIVVPINVISDAPVLSVQFLPGAGGNYTALAGSLFNAQVLNSSLTTTTYELLSGPGILDNLPNKMMIDANTGLISWTPDPNTPTDDGQQTVTVRGTNSAGIGDRTFGFYSYFTGDVTNIQVIDLAELHPTATWTAPTGPGSDQVDHYHITAVARWRAGRSRRSHSVSYDTVGTETSLLMTDLTTRAYSITITPVDAAGNNGLPHAPVAKFAPRPAFPVLSWTINDSTGFLNSAVIAGNPMTIVLTDRNTALPSTIELVSGPVGLTFDPTTNTAIWTPGAADVTQGYTKTNVIFRATNIIGSRESAVVFRVLFSGPVTNASAVRPSGTNYATVNWTAPTDNVTPIAGYKITRHWRWSGRRRSTTFTIQGNVTSTTVGLWPTGWVSHRGVTITPFDNNGNFGVSTYVPFVRV